MEQQQSAIDGLRRISKSVQQKARRDCIQAQLVSDAGNKCRRCEKRYHPSVYDFHHKDPKHKEFNLSRKNFNKKYSELKKESRKCVLLCANCHREVHIFMEKEFLDYEPSVEIKGL